MGEKKVSASDSVQQRRTYVRQLLRDLQAIRLMQAEGLFQSGVQRIGAEQEIFVVDHNFRPSSQGPQLLERLADPNYTHELARYTMEINLDPVKLGGLAFSLVEHQLTQLMKKAEAKAQDMGLRLVTIGILPTIGIGELDAQYMTPLERYRQMEQRIRELRGGGDTELAIQGIDDLMMRHDNILFEACNTSFQVHLQIDPEDFVDAYNWAQAISGIVLAISTNSPLLFGRELWAETRIALFQQSVDTRSRDLGLRQRQARVYFGNRWLRESLLEIFREDIARYPLLLTGQLEDSLTLLRRGIVPQLRALALHNGTIWKWNRPCFGSDGRLAHVRIENRYLPAGPTITDEMANAAFWVGLMRGRPESMGRIWEKMDFREAKENFLKAAQHGLDVELSWLGQSQNARRLILDYFLPMARQGLIDSGVDRDEVAKYLGVVEHRAVTRMTGSKWLRQSFRTADPSAELLQRETALTKAYWKNQCSGLPVADWVVEALQSRRELDLMAQRVDQLMSTDLITVGEQDLLQLALQIMKWRNIRHMPVEDPLGRIVGLLSRSDFNDEFRRLEWETLQGLDALTADEPSEEGVPNSESGTPLGPDVTCGDRMVPSPLCIAPEVSAGQARQLMLDHGIGCLPIVIEGKLVGLITKRDIQRMESQDSTDDSPAQSPLTN